MLRALNQNAGKKAQSMTVITHAMPYLFAGIALHALVACLFRGELLDQLNAVRVRSRRNDGR
jgi:hypothetical protein